jgi:heptosyltransferase I
LSRMQILLVRLSSLGDLLHSLPALTDAARALPHATFDWVCDQAFEEIPQWHTNLNFVIPVPSNPFGGGRLLAALRNRRYMEFLKKLRAKKYDLIIDLQGEWKSAIASRFAKGPLAGYDSASIHEWGAHFFYGKKFYVAKNQHSIQRMRRLVAQVLGYSLPLEIDYGIDAARFPDVQLQVAKPYIVFIHSTSWKSKCWPELYWQHLATEALANGFSIVLPWGTDAERDRAARIANGSDRMIVLPKLSIAEKASVIAGATATVGLDTGLSHIAAALGIPSVTLYGATDANLIGATGKNQVHMSSRFVCVNCHKANCTYPGESTMKPACFEIIRPEQVWSALTQLMTSANRV